MSVIIVGVDGSPNSRVAVEWAARQAHVGEIQELFETAWCAPLVGSGITFRTELRYGSSVPVLLEVADETEADLIVVGSRGLGGTPELLLGSTSTQVAQHSRRPVTIVPT